MYSNYIVGGKKKTTHTFPRTSSSSHNIFSWINHKHKKGQTYNRRYSRARPTSLFISLSCFTYTFTFTCTYTKYTSVSNQSFVAGVAFVETPHLFIQNIATTTNYRRQRQLRHLHKLD